MGHHTLPHTGNNMSPTHPPCFIDISKMHRIFDMSFPIAFLTKVHKLSLWLGLGGIVNLRFVLASIDDVSRKLPEGPEGTCQISSKIASIVTAQTDWCSAL